MLSHRDCANGTLKSLTASLRYLKQYITQSVVWFLLFPDSYLHEMYLQLVIILEIRFILFTNEEMSKLGVKFICESTRSQEPCNASWALPSVHQIPRKPYKPFKNTSSHKRALAARCPAHHWLPLLQGRVSTGTALTLSHTVLRHEP